ncbi:hypothetical protein MKX03_006481 [Papaver bracteatum]|nr:hypothetical protein MKX03_006481 [Papaver bracteatum]
MKRNPRKVKWTKAYRRIHGKDMTKDSTFEFERKRNRPERYDRIRVEKTLEAMKEIIDMRHTREIVHHKQRMKGNKSKMMKEERKELDQCIPTEVRVETPPKIKVYEKTRFMPWKSDKFQLSTSSSFI